MIRSDGEEKRNCQIGVRLFEADREELERRAKEAGFASMYQYATRVLEDLVRGPKRTVGVSSLTEKELEEMMDQLVKDALKATAPERHPNEKRQSRERIEKLLVVAKEKQAAAERTIADYQKKLDAMEVGPSWKKEREQIRGKLNAAIIEKGEQEDYVTWFEGELKKMVAEEKRHQVEAIEVLNEKASKLQVLMAQSVAEGVDDLARRCGILKTFRQLLSDQRERLGGAPIRGARIWWSYQFENWIAHSELRNYLSNPPRRDRANYRSSFVEMLGLDGENVKEMDLSALKDEERQAKVMKRRAESAERLDAAREKFAQAAEKFREENE